MSSTRRSDPQSPMAFEKYMSAPEFVALRPIPGSAVMAKARLYSDAKARELAFFLQAMSMQNGGLRNVAERLVAWFPEQCREEDSKEADELRFALSIYDYFDPEEVRDPEAFKSLPRRTALLLGSFLADLTINPKLDLTKVECPCFADLHEAIARFKDEFERRVHDQFVTTTTSKAVMATLDQALRVSRMVVIEGMAGSGKSTSAKAWCNAGLGRARYVSLTGITNRTTFFHKVAAALGFSTCQRKAQQLQVLIEEFFARSKMMLIIDEAHYLWPQSVRQITAPELIDWIDTALVNYGVPVALVCTDQFSKLKNRVERNSGWTSEQFIHRVFRFKKLDDTPTRNDVLAVTRSLLSATWDGKSSQWVHGTREGPAAALDGLVSYALLQKVPFACVASCIDEARAYARAGDRLVVSIADVRQALRDGQIPSDDSLSRSFNPAPSERRAPRAAPSAPAGRSQNKAFAEVRRTAIPAGRDELASRLGNSSTASVK